MFVRIIDKPLTVLFPLMIFIFIFSGDPSKDVAKFLLMSDNTLDYRSNKCWPPNLIELS